MTATLFSGGACFDGQSFHRQGLAVLVEGDRIARVAPIGEFAGFAGTKVDTGGGTLLPGLIDCHVHLTLSGEADPSSALAKMTDAQVALAALKRARDTLAGGVVAVRDCGGRNYVDLAVRDSIARGDHPGPTVRAAGRMICMTGGHGNQNARVADGVDDVVKAVREQIHAGADFIKIMATGGVMTPGVNPEDAHYSRAEMVAGLAEARRFGKRTASHAQGAEGVMNAVLGGVSSIEHGIYMDDACIQAMIDRGTYLVATLAAVRNIVDHKDRGIPPWAVEKALRAYERHIQSVKAFAAAGGKLAMGTDAGTPFNQHGRNTDELTLLAEHGIPALQILTAATANAADLLALPDHGHLRAGAKADLLLVDGDPAADIAAVADRRHHRAVYKDGKPAGDAATRVVGKLSGLAPAAI